MIAIYERVSSTTQDTAAQHRDLDTWAKSREVEWFADTFTGTTMERPAWEQLWAACCAGRIGTVVVWRLDRLGRTAGRRRTAIFLGRLGLNAPQN